MTKKIKNILKKPISTEFTFIDLFAGIGGFHLAMEKIGGKCVFASEIDEHARKTYEHNFKKSNPELFSKGLFNKDIKSIMPQEIPDFDILCAGFPCQPFSQAGHKKGFEDTSKSERGNLFFDVADIISIKRPKAFFLENVRGLVNHDNGNTFKIIRNILVNELGYSFYYQIVNASDYGLPQLRPRTFMVGFRDEGLLQGFEFPQKIPLKFTMSDVWGGSCSREVGFTLRVGGRGSKIDDRRNWDSYLVDGEVKRLSYHEAMKMQGFPSSYHFPVSNTQAMKQLGNSVAVDAVEEVAKSLLSYMKQLDKDTNLKTTNNKGEWTELFAFVKLLKEQNFPLSDSDLSAKSDIIKVNKVTTKNIDLDFHILDQNNIKAISSTNQAENIIDISTLLTDDVINTLYSKIKDGSGTFEIAEFEVVQTSLGFNIVKGGNSNQKSDIVLDIEHNSIEKENEGFGIKSYIGAKPTLLNASGNTNFIFQITNLDSSKVSEINNINSRTKLKDRIEKINECSGVLTYLKAEKETMEYNLKMIDTNMPQIIGQVLLAFYEKRISKINDIVNYLADDTTLLTDLSINDKQMLTSKIKKLLVGIMLGFFAGTKWDGEYESNGTIVVKSTGNIVGFHIIDLATMEDYLFNNIKLDTPSTSRHKYGSIIEDKGQHYFKLNLQMRF